MIFEVVSIQLLTFLVSRLLVFVGGPEHGEQFAHELL